MLCPKNPPLRDRRYLDSLRDERCIITGQHGSDAESVDPAHIGVCGRGMKADDNCALPIIHSVHREMHDKGAATILRRMAPDDVILSAFRALARELYAEKRNV